MKSLYEGEKYTEDACSLSIEASEILKPMFKKYFDKGYSFREISHIIISEVYSLECLEILKKSVKDHKKSKSG